VASGGLSQVVGVAPTFADGNTPTRQRPGFARLRARVKPWQGELMFGHGNI